MKVNRWYQRTGDSGRDLRLNTEFENVVISHEFFPEFHRMQLNCLKSLDYSFADFAEMPNNSG